MVSPSQMTESDLHWFPSATVYLQQRQTDRQTWRDQLSGCTKRHKQIRPCFLFKRQRKLNHADLVSSTNWITNSKTKWTTSCRHLDYMFFCGKHNYCLQGQLCVCVCVCVRACSGVTWLGIIWHDRSFRNSSCFQTSSTNCSFSLKWRFLQSDCTFQAPSLWMSVP